MKIEIRSSGGPNMAIPLPNAMLFSPTLLNGLLKIGKHAEKNIPEIPPETVRQACRAIKDYTKKLGSWELVHVESADGTTVIITI